MELFAFTTEQELCGFRNMQGRVIIEPQYDGAAFSLLEGLAQVKKSGKWGFINQHNEIIIPFHYDNAVGFIEDFAAVQNSGKWGFISKNNLLTIPFQFESVGNFSEGFAAVQDSGKWGFINKNNEKVIPLQYDNTKAFSEGLTAVQLDNRWGFINNKGGTIIPFNFESVENFSEGLAAVSQFVDGEELWGYIDNNNIIVIPLQYFGARKFSDGYAAVLKYINPDYGSDVLYEENGFINPEDLKWGYINRNNENVIHYIYDDAREFSEGLASVTQMIQIDDYTHIPKLGFIDKHGVIIIPMQYEEVYKAFTNGIAIVNQDGKILFIDKSGKEM